MSQSYVGEVRLVGFNFAPVGWELCQGQQMAISENPTLFNLIGTTYGGNGETTFNLPNLQGTLPIHQGTGRGGTYVIGQTGGAETVVLSVSQYPEHNHTLQASTTSTGGVNDPANLMVGGGSKVYSNETPAAAMNAAMVGLSGGGSQPHENMQPYLVLNWIIALYGIYPSQG
ncbi:MAG: tail fiber protein [Terracidiphilus sp.]|jgi:microcystin-dependent protein